MLVTKSAIRPGSNFNRQGGSIFHQRQHHYKMMMREAYSDDSEIAAKTQEQQADAQGAVHA
ncbi:hypothetical protein AO989_32705 [Pseudomonas aeruginosa]|nr:hypothetical protein AO989_32705 [Pseudomonas aeruginosa]